MKKLTCQLSFNTPAFLGNAKQQAQWRTPPFKALLRQWWRIVKAKELNYNHQHLLESENCLFGAAADDKTGGKSKLRLRLNHWDKGKMESWPEGGESIFHPEVGTGGRQVSAELYLGFGPLSNRQRGARLSDRNGIKHTAIAPKTHTAQLQIGIPEQYAKEIEETLNLIASFGTLGSRARNGWGSLHIADSAHQDNLNDYARELSDCFQNDWAHAIGRDNRGLLVWQTKEKADWREAIKELAEIKIRFRTAFEFTTGKKSHKLEERHLLAYPVTHHDVSDWGMQSRLANQIRFKVIKKEKFYLGQIVHLPCALPDELCNKIKGAVPDELKVWQQVHRTLDKALPNGRLTATGRLL